MRARAPLALALIGVVAAGVSAHAAPAKPKNFKKSVAYTDATPDPSGNANDDEADHCSGKLPSSEKGIAVRLPGPGYLDVALGGFQGDWSLQIRDTKGGVLSGVDVNPPDYESTSIRVKRATNVVIFPCNMGGTPNGKVTYSYTYKK